MTVESKAHLIPILESGGWVFEDIMPVFLRTLRKELFQGGIAEDAIRDVKPFALTALRYNLITPSELGENLSCFCDEPNASRLTPFQNPSLFKRFAHLVSKDAEFFTPTEKAIQVFQEAENLMQQRDMSCWETYNAHVDKLYYFNNLDAHAASHPHFFGVIFIGEDRFRCSLERIIISLVHELAHQEFFLLNAVDRFVLESADSHLVHAPFQGRKRPPIGRLHACHALYRMLQSESELGIDSGDHKRLFRESLSTLSVDELTPFAGNLLQNVYQPYTQKF